MRALTYDGLYRTKVRQKPEPRIEHPMDGIVKVRAAAICGSDLHLLHGMVPDTRIGATLGHEFVGEVVGVGPEADGVRVGDRVAVPFNIFCGACWYCSRGLTSSCENTNPATDLACGIYGYSHSMGGYEGGQAQYVRVPFVGVDAERIPEDVDDLDALAVTDTLPTGYQAAEMANINGGETVVVFGAGPVGLFAMKAAWLFGAGRVIAVDQLDYRLKFARRFAEVEAFDFREGDIVETILEETNGRGAHACIDAVGLEAAGSPVQRGIGIYGKMAAGSAAALNTAIQCTRKGGTVVAIGVYGPPWTLMDFGAAMNKQLTIRAGQCSVKRYMPRMFEHIRAGRIDAQRLFTHRLSLEEGPGAYHTFAQKREDCIKVALYPNGTIH